MRLAACQSKTLRGLILPRQGHIRNLKYLEEIADKPYEMEPYCPRGRFAAMALFGLVAVAQGQNTPQAEQSAGVGPAFHYYADLRLRYELDWNSENTSGAERVSRNRGRVRARAGFDYRLGEGWSVGTRLRTGSTASQQSLALTFAGDDGVRDKPSVVADRYFVQFQKGGLTVWGGRNTSPFWQQNELFWDENVSPTGLAVTYQTRAGKGTAAAIGGVLLLPDGGYGLSPLMTAGQFKYSVPVGSSRLTIASGLHYLQGRAGARYLPDRNGARDYLVGVNSAQWSIPMRTPLTLGADLFHNFVKYDAAGAAPFPVTDRNETLGFVLAAQCGQLKARGNFLLGYYYARIELFSVNASYAEDDWIRFGNGAQTQASDFKGHEIRLGYALSRKVNLVARLYLVQTITTPQDGNRFRLDWNWQL